MFLLPKLLHSILHRLTVLAEQASLNRVLQVKRRSSSKVYIKQFHLIVSHPWNYEKLPLPVLLADLQE